MSQVSEKGHRHVCSLCRQFIMLAHSYEQDSFCSQPWFDISAVLGGEIVPQRTF